MDRVALITGSTGYIGSRLSRFLEELPDWRVIRVDRTSGYDFSVPGWARRLPEERVDVVFHLAQSRRYREFPEGATDMLRVNVASTLELAEWARSHHVKSFVLASSGTVYAPSENRLTEDAPCHPATMYAATKLSAEHILQPFSDRMDIVIARLFSVYGPGQSGTLIAEMIDRVASGREITLADNAGIYLTPLFVDDCVRILERLTVEFRGRGATLINVAGDHVVSLDKIVSDIEHRLQKKAVTRATQERARWLCADNGCLREFYTEPLVRFEDGIEEALRHVARQSGGPLDG